MSNELEGREKRVLSGVGGSTTEEYREEFEGVEDLATASALREIRERALLEGTPVRKTPLIVDTISRVELVDIPLNGPPCIACGSSTVRVLMEHITLGVDNIGVRTLNTPGYECPEDGTGFLVT